MLSIWFSNINPKTDINKPTINANVIALPINFSASSFLPWPNLIDMFVVVPIPINIPNAIIIVIIGIVTPSPVIASGPTPGMFPINILSTTLYNPFTIIPIIAGTEYFISNFPIGSVPKICWLSFILNLLFNILTYTYFL